MKNNARQKPNTQLHLFHKSTKHIIEPKGVLSDSFAAHGNVYATTAILYRNKVRYFYTNHFTVSLYSEIY